MATQTLRQSAPEAADEGICLTCGQLAPLTYHYVAGPGNYDHLMVWVCLPCSAHLLHWQRAAGIEPPHGQSRAEADRTRGLIIGTIHLMQMYAHRHPQHGWCSFATALHTSHAFARLLDGLVTAEPPNGHAQGLTDVSSDHLSWPPIPEAAWAEHFAKFVVDLTHILSDLLPVGVDTLTASVIDPVWWAQELARLGRDFDTEHALMSQLIAYTAAIQKCVLLVLNPDVASATEERMLDEIWNCVDTSRHLLTELLQQVTQAAGT